MNDTPYFSVSEHRSRLREVATTWVGTPFHAHGCVKGRSGGVSCVGLIYTIALEIGLIQDGEIELPETQVYWHTHNEISLLGKFFRSPQVRGRVKRTDLEDGVMVGDLISIKLNKTENHLAQVIDPDHVIHCHRKKGVMVSSILDLQSFIGGVYRIY